MLLVVDHRDRTFLTEEAAYAMMYHMNLIDWRCCTYRVCKYVKRGLSADARR